MKIVIFTGGTGSIALQRGLHHMLDERLDGVETKIVVNAYDNGLSTGAVRRVMEGRILGPSDVRKNQATRLQLERPNSPWLKFLSYRFTASPSEAYQLCEEATSQLIRALDDGVHCSDCRRILIDALDQYFQSPRAEKIEYDDFAIANVIYAGLAAANGNSLRMAARVMAEAMGILDNILLNDDESLFLGAVTESGYRLMDEGEIVFWGNESDPIVDIFFVDANGAQGRPHLCLESWKAIVEADLIVLSSGTLWSSLVPTYASEGFAAAVRVSKATVLMVVNRTPDRDSPSQTASDMIDILVPRYFEAGRLHVLADENGHPRMRSLSQSARSKVADFTRTTLSGPSDPQDKHDPRKLAEAVGHVFFKEHLQSSYFLFDYDDTLVGRGKAYPKSSRFNVGGLGCLSRLTHVGICSGNAIGAIDLEYGRTHALDSDAPLLIFADGGVNEYSYDIGSRKSDRGALTAVRCIEPSLLLPTDGPSSAEKIVESLSRAGIPLAHIEIRGNVVIAIKPVDQEYRRPLLQLIKVILAGTDLVVRERGRTTIEICNRSVSKIHALECICDHSPASARITYVGDEFESGNDRDIESLAAREKRVTCLHVDSPAKTAFFISILIAHLTSNVDR